MFVRGREVRRDALALLEVDARLQEMRREGMAQAMDATRLANPRTGFRNMVNAVGRRAREGMLRAAARKEPQRRAISAKRKSRRPYGVRKPTDYDVQSPGDLVEVDVSPHDLTRGRIVRKIQNESTRIGKENL